MEDNKKYEKLSRDDVNSTKIMAGQHIFTIPELEQEMKVDSEVGKKLKSIEDELAKY